MAQMIIIRGEVVGGHELVDLGVTVPYRQEISLSRERASRSRDLADAFRLGYVVQVRIKNYMDSQPRASARVATKPPKPVRVAPRPSRPHKQEAPVQKTPPGLPVSVEEAPQKAVSMDYHQELMEQNKRLQDTTERLLDAQAALLSQVQELLKRPVAVAAPVVASDSGASTKDSGAKTLPDADLEWEDEDDIYVPSTVRTGNAMVRGDASGEAETLEDDLSDAANVLASLRGKGKKRGKKNTT